MSQDLLREILGGLIMKPGLLESTDLSAADFPAGPLQEAFKEIAKTWSVAKPTEIDPVILSERLGGKDSQLFVASLITGSIRVEPSIFQGRVKEARRQALTARIRSKLHEQDALPWIDVNIIRQDLEALDRLSIMNGQPED